MDNSEEKLADLFRAMGDRSRFKVLSYLLKGSRNVSEIVRALQMKQSLVSHHLKVLRECGLVQADRNGPFVSYSVASGEIRALVDVAMGIVRNARSVQREG